MHIFNKLTVTTIVLVVVAFACLASCDHRLEQCKSELSDLQQSLNKMQSSWRGRIITAELNSNSKSARLIEELNKKREECKNYAQDFTDLMEIDEIAPEGDSAREFV